MSASLNSKCRYSASTKYSTHFLAALNANAYNDMICFIKVYHISTNFSIFSLCIGTSLQRLVPVFLSRIVPYLWLFRGFFLRLIVQNGTVILIHIKQNVKFFQTCGLTRQFFLLCKGRVHFLTSVFKLLFCISQFLTDSGQPRFKAVQGIIHTGMLPNTSAPSTTV